MTNLSCTLVFLYNDDDYNARCSSAASNYIAVIVLLSYNLVPFHSGTRKILVKRRQRESCTCETNDGEINSQYFATHTD